MIEGNIKVFDKNSYPLINNRAMAKPNKKFAGFLGKGAMDPSQMSPAKRKDDEDTTFDRYVAVN